MKRHKLYFRMFVYLRPHIHWLIITSALSIFTVVFESSSLWLLATLADTLFNPNKAVLVRPEFAFNASVINETIKYWVQVFIRADNPLNSLNRVCLIFMVTYLLKNIFAYINSLTVALLNLGVVQGLRNGIYSHALMLPITAP